MSNKDRKVRPPYEHHTFMTTGFGKFRIIIEADFSAETDIPKVTARARRVPLPAKIARGKAMVSKKEAGPH